MIFKSDTDQPIDGQSRLDDHRKRGRRPIDFFRRHQHVYKRNHILPTSQIGCYPQCIKLASKSICNDLQRGPDESVCKPPSTIRNTSDNCRIYREIDSDRKLVLSLLDRRNIIAQRTKLTLGFNYGKSVRHASTRLPHVINMSSIMKRTLDNSH